MCLFFHTYLKERTELLNDRDFLRPFLIENNQNTIGIASIGAMPIRTDILLMIVKT